MNKKYLFLKLMTVILFSAMDFKAFAQSGGCGTIVSADQVAYESTLSIAGGNLTQSLPQVNRSLSVKVYVVKDDKGIPGVGSLEIQSAIGRLNDFFQPISLVFKICDVSYVDNYQFNNLSAGGNEADLVSEFSEKNIINLYLVSRLADQQGGEVCGYTYMPSSAKNFIFIKKGCLSGTALAHQLGHFLNLYHTHEMIFGRELADRSNCAETGDKCCDTEADPGLEGLVDGSCLYTGRLKDANGDFYRPIPKNLMAYGNDGCRSYFSGTQFLRMIYTLKNLKIDLR